MARGKTRSKRTREIPNDPKPPSLTSVFDSLISELSSSQGLELPSLKILYGRLLRLSLNKSTPFSDSYSLSAQFERCGISSEYIDKVGEILFKELESRFEMFFSGPCEVSEHGNAVLGSDAEVRLDGLTCLLRCCMVFLTLADPNVVLGKAQFLLQMIGKVIYRVTKGDENISPTFGKPTSHDHDAVSEDFHALLSILERSGLYQTFLCAVLEVIADELLVHRLVRGYFVRAGATYSSISARFMNHFLDGDAGCLLEMISLRFILSISDEEACQNFLRRLSSVPCNDLRASELSLTSSLSLLLNPGILSAPKMLQVHLILMVSEAIGFSMSFQNNMGLIGTSYLKAVEWSVFFYTRFVSTFLREGHTLGRKDSSSISGFFGQSSEPAFECHIQVQEVTRAKIHSLVLRLASLCNLNQRNEVQEKTKSNLLAHSVACIDESRADESCKEDIVSILNSLVLGAYSDSISNIGLYEKDDSCPQDVYLLAAVLKLMSSSMSAIIWCLRHDAEKLVCLKHSSLGKAYGFMANVIECFEHFNVSLPNQKKLFDIMIESTRIRNKTTKWMLLHISGLLSLSFATGLDFLVENCVSALVALMNLYVFEEGNVGAMRSLLVPESSSFSSQEPLHKLGKISVDKKLCQKIASRIQEIQSRLLRSESPSREDKKAKTSRKSFMVKCGREFNEGKEEAKKTCDGKAFLDFLLKDSDSSDYSDLVDFIECKAGKDYSRWLKEKQRHRKWKSQRIAFLRREKRKKPWKLMTANMTYPDIVQPKRLKAKGFSFH